jgi:hypothetical protein
MTEYQSNSYDDDDMEAILSVLDEKDDEAETIMASARGKVAAIRKWQKAEIKRAKDELGIPTGVLKPLRKIRALEKQIQKVTDDVSEDLIEVYEDAVGQFSLFKPEGDDPAPETAAEASAKARKKAVREAHEAEQAEGERVIDEMIH